MQRSEQGGIVISCDFCGVDWDAYDQTMSRPMVEGHRGSVICLECLKRALKEMREPAAGDEYSCVMCLREGLTEARWFHPSPTPGAGLNAGAVVCRACIRQAAGRFGKDPEVAFEWPRRGA